MSPRSRIPRENQEVKSSETTQRAELRVAIAAQARPWRGFQGVPESRHIWARDGGHQLPKGTGHMGARYSVQSQVTARAKSKIL